MSKPSTPSTLRLRGLESNVDVYRDRWGVPHARARSEHDAFFAQGYLHAADRLWQMDSVRRKMQGRWAEWVGPAGVASDALARRLGAGRAAERDWRALSPAARTMLEAYAAGVNACIGLGRPLPPEYAFTGGEPERWQPWHSIDAMRQRGYLMGSLWFKLWRAAALKAVGPEQVAKLRYDDGGIDRLCIPPGADAERWIATLRDLAPAIEALAVLTTDNPDGGSNNWAIAPQRSATGHALLAGDPHRQFEMPGMYAQGHVACDRFDAIGLGVPGVPGLPHFGHNGHVAWGVTHAYADIHDLFVERFRGAGSTLAAEFRGGWQAAARRRETIAVRGGAAVEIDIVETRHGPVVAGEPGRGSALVLRSAQFIDTDRSFECLQPMLTARSVPELYEATRGWGLIDHNLVAADTAGQIGHLVRAIVPRRPRSNGWLPVPGWTGDHEWQGCIPFEEMPRAIDPPRGFIVTANNRFVADDVRDGAPYFCTDCQVPHRARRIEAMLDALPKATPEDMAAIHRDVESLAAPLLQRLLASAEASCAGAEAMRRAIVEWDARLDARSVPAAAYSAFRWALAQVLAERSGLAAAVGQPLYTLPHATAPLLQMWFMLPQLIRADDTALLGGWSWPQAAQQALSRAAAAFDGRPWGEQHRARLAHPLGGLSAEAAAALEFPGLGVAGDNETVMASSCTPASGLDAASGSIARYVFDAGNWDNSRWIVLDGVSGIAGHPHRSDQHAAWARGELVPALYSWAAVAANSGERSTLQPA